MNLYSLIEKQVLDDTIKKIAIGVVIRNNDRYLVLKRTKTMYLEGYYEIPTGNLEFGETIEECIYRLVNEKIGCVATNINRYLGHFDYISSDGKKARQYNFLVQVQDLKNITLSEKHDNYKIADIYECENNLDISEETLFILKTANITKKFNLIGEKRYEYWKRSKISGIKRNNK